jgi:6-pyruvoyl-tetrahydropterin synthase
MHGATYTVDAALFTDDIDDHGLVVDIGLATEALADTLAPLRYKNLDEMPEFEEQFTTTEFLCGHIFRELARRVHAGKLNDGGRVKRLRVMLHESHVARAWFEGDV